MANLDRGFEVIGSLSAERAEQIKQAVKKLDGVNQVRIDSGSNQVIVGYTPGIIAAQSIKETIESQGVDVSDQGDD